VDCAASDPGSSARQSRNGMRNRGIGRLPTKEVAREGMASGTRTSMQGSWRERQLSGRNRSGADSHSEDYGRRRQRQPGVADHPAGVRRQLCRLCGINRKDMQSRAAAFSEKPAPISRKIKSISNIRSELRHRPHETSAVGGWRLRTRPLASVLNALRARHWRARSCRAFDGAAMLGRGQRLTCQTSPGRSA